MDTCPLACVLTFSILVIVTILILKIQFGYHIHLRPHQSSSSKSCTKPIIDNTEKTDGNWATKTMDDDEADIGELKELKQLYHRLHNLEKFPEVLPQAKRHLLSLLKETNTKGQALSEHGSILSVRSFSRRALQEFQQHRDSNIGKDWEKYNTRRKNGGLRELFVDREEAIWWLKQIAPVKYVDGAWLGHIGKVTTPFALRKTMKGAWQILSEELGDGDLGKHHVHLYHELLMCIAPGFPTPGEEDFGHARHRLDQLSVWKSAVAQLLISLFPREFLPEILGFNLHFEAITMDTLRAGKELKEVGIDSYYFILHISIDNSHSGHSAIAIEIICEYMDFVRRVEGQESAQKAWKRIQAGYLLSSGLPGTVTCPSRNPRIDSPVLLLTPIESEVIRIFKAKAQVVHGIHCSSRVKIGPRSVADWLNPVELESKEWQKALLDALSHSKYWICRGNSSKSRFMQELQWNGRMFGSFIQDEFDVLRGWIDGLPHSPLTREDPYTRTRANDGDDDILSEYPVFLPRSTASLSRPCVTLVPVTSLYSFQCLPPLVIGKFPTIEKFVPLWLSHACLLQAFVSVPFRTNNKFACMIVKILRAQGGFDIEQECVAGMGEIHRPNSLGLIGIGMNLMEQHGLSLDEFHSLNEVLKAWPSEFAVNMLHLSMRPMEYKGLLIGMTTAFAQMHVTLAKAHVPMLSTQDQVILKDIARRELEGLEFCWQELQSDGDVYADCSRGYLMAAGEIKKCFLL